MNDTQSKLLDIEIKNAITIIRFNMCETEFELIELWR